MLHYDPDKEVPVYGFGCRLTTEGDSETKKTKIHCFACNGDMKKPEAEKLGGIEAVYKNARDKVKMSGPTNFGPILQ